MADKRCPCAKYFNNVLDIDYALNTMFVDNGSSWTFSSLKPWLPVGVMQKVHDAGTGLDTWKLNVALSKAQAILFPAIAADVLKANDNYTKDIVDLSPQYIAGNYGQYLSVNQGVSNAPERLNKFNSLYSNIWDFWQKFDPATTDEQALKLQQEFLVKLQSTTDKRFWLPPGTYFLQDVGLSKSYAIFNTLVATLGNPVPVQTIELNSLG